MLQQQVVGAWMQDQHAAGFWTPQMSQKHSNYRELFAVLMALHAFKGQITGKSIQIVLDNITTVAYLNHLGGSTQQLSKIASAICTFAYENNVSLSARHHAGKKNMLAE